MNSVKKKSEYFAEALDGSVGIENVCKLRLSARMFFFRFRQADDALSAPPAQLICPTSKRLHRDWQIGVDGLALRDNA
jgi:hypothetical protein